MFDVHQISQSRPVTCHDRSVQVRPPAPLYAQIKDALRERIHDGTYAEDSQIPSESELMAEFKVSRITVQRALTDLQNERIIFRIAGKGSFVSRTSPVQDLTSLQGFAEAMGAQGFEVFNKLLSLRHVPAAPEIAQRLGVAEGSTVTEIRRVRHLNRAPVSVDLTYVTAAIGERLEQEDLATRDIFLILENDFRIDLGHATLRIDAIPADKDLAQRLHVKIGAPILRIERLTHTAAGTPLDFEYLYYRGDTFRYQMRIERRQSQPKA